jgi:hypothetical protein
MGCTRSIPSATHIVAQEIAMYSAFRASAWMLLTAATLTFSWGCGSGSLQTHPVTGRVVFADGKPLTAGVVEFESLEEGSKRLNARGAIQPDGSFRLSTTGRDGAVEGLHRAIVVPRLSGHPGSDDGPLPKPPFHTRFQSYEKSGLRYTVTPAMKPVTITVRKP